jgi:hypothetical protein
MSYDEMNTRADGEQSSLLSRNFRTPHGKGNEEAWKSEYKIA